MPSQMEGKDWQTWPAHIYAKSKRASDWLYFVTEKDGGWGLKTSLCSCATLQIEHKVGEKYPPSEKSPVHLGIAELFRALNQSKCEG